MKRLLSVLLFFSGSTVFACPFCGCGNSNFQVGILPNYSRAFVGVRYTYSQFNSLSNDGSQFSHDYFHTTELWGGVQLGKFQVMGFVPYITSHKSSDDGIVNAHGLGDVMVIVNYKILSHSHTNSKTQRTYSNSLFVGGGVKMHTGQSRVDVNDPDFTVGDFSATPGTGSTDYLLNAMHTFLAGNNGIVTNATYRINTANAEQFRYGNRVYANVAYFHSFSADEIIIRPSLGLNLIINETNYYQSQAIADSHGHILSGMMGVNVQRGKIGLLLNGFLPIHQNLFNGQTHFQSRGSVALTFSF